MYDSLAFTGEQTYCVTSSAILSFITSLPGIPSVFGNLIPSWHTNFQKTWLLKKQFPFKGLLLEKYKFQKSALASKVIRLVKLAKSDVKCTDEIFEKQTFLRKRNFGKIPCKYPL